MSLAEEAFRYEILRIRKALVNNNGTITKAAKELGMSRYSVMRRLNETQLMEEEELCARER